MLKKISIIILVISLIVFGFLYPKDELSVVKEVVSPVEIVLDNNEVFVLDGVETFDSNFSERNKLLAKKFNITENEAFIIGTLGKYWAQNILSGRDVKVAGNDLIYYKYNYRFKFLNSPYCIKDGEISNKYLFDKLLKSVRKTDYVLVSDGKAYPVGKYSGSFILMRKSHYNKMFPQNKKECILPPTLNLDLGNIKIILSDFTSKLKPDRNCSTDICKEILYNINNAQKSIDIAIYGYSSTPAIENAVKNAQKRGVKIRLVYDTDSRNENIYPNTFEFAALILENTNDGVSKDVNMTMHNKFYIFDEKVVITGSANLSHTDMSGYNSNSIIVIKSPEAAKIYKAEFEQMFEGKFHRDKISGSKSNPPNMEIYFSPQDKALSNGVLPRIKNAKKSIYIPAFFITENSFTQALINAKKRGVDVKVIIDALSASSKYSKHRELRNFGVPVKTENYAGKMHSKSIIIDDEYVIIGSMNFSKSGENKNDENLIIYKNAQAAKFYKTFFLYLWQKIPDKWLKYDPKPESLDSIGSCADGVDNDYDSFTDIEDDACKYYGKTGLGGAKT